MIRQTLMLLFLLLKTIRCSNQGGAVAYAAAVASALGVRACVVTGDRIEVVERCACMQAGSACLSGSTVNMMQADCTVMHNSRAAHPSPLHFAAGSSDADMSAFRGHELHRVATNETLTFEHTYTWWGHRRKLRVTAQPGKVLTAAHVPRHCRRARVVLLGPLTPQDMDAASFVRMRAGDALVATHSFQLYLRHMP
jgi:hypothetical protein